MSYSEVLVPTASLLTSQGIQFMNEVSQKYKDQKTLFIHEKSSEIWVPPQEAFASEIKERIKTFSDFCNFSRTQPWGFIIAHTCLDTHWEFSLACQYQYIFQEQRVGWSRLGPYDPFCQVKKIFLQTKNLSQQNYSSIRKKYNFPFFYQSVDKTILPHLLHDFVNSVPKKINTKRIHTTPQSLDPEITTSQLKKIPQGDEDQYFHTCAYSLLKIKKITLSPLKKPDISPQIFALDVQNNLPPRDILKFLLTSGHQIFLFCKDQNLLQQRLESTFRKLENPSLFSRVMWGMQKPTKNVTHITWNATQTLALHGEETLNIAVGIPGNHRLDNIVLEVHNQHHDKASFSKTIPGIIYTQTDFQIPLIYLIRIALINEIIECSRFFQNEIQLVMNILQSLDWHFLNDTHAWEHLLLHWGHKTKTIGLINAKNHIQGLDRWSQIKKTCFHKQRSKHWNQTELIQHLYLFSELLQRTCITKKWITKQDCEQYWGSITGIPQKEKNIYIETCGEKRLLWETQLRWP
ncbi:MAG: hypothetical protein AB8C84_04075 [Oligoflexales bacterium]